MGPARPQRADLSAAGRGAGFAPAGSARLADGLRCAHRRAGTNRGLCAPAPPGLPPAGPLLDAQKWAEKPLGKPQTPSFCPIGRYHAETVRCHRISGSFGDLISAGYLIRLRLTAC